MDRSKALGAASPGLGFGGQRSRCCVSRARQHPGRAQVGRGGLPGLFSLTPFVGKLTYIFLWVVACSSDLFCSEISNSYSKIGMLSLPCN